MYIQAQVSQKTIIREMGSADLLIHYKTLNDSNDMDHKLRDLCVKCYRELTGKNLPDEI